MEAMGHRCLVQESFVRQPPLKLQAFTERTTAIATLAAGLDQRSFYGGSLYSYSFMPLLADCLQS